MNTESRKVLPTSTKWEFHPTKGIAHLLNLLLYPIPKEEAFAGETLGNIFQENNDNPETFAELAASFLTEQINKSGLVSDITCVLTLTNQPLADSEAIYTLSVLDKDNKNIFNGYTLVTGDNNIRLEEDHANYR